MRIFISGEVDKQAASFFREVRKEISDNIKILESKNYGSNVERLGIIPIITQMTPGIESAGFFEERKLYKKKEADIRIKIDYEKFVNSNFQTRKFLMLKNIIESIRWLNNKV